MLKPLPVGFSTFRKIISGGYLYVDKTKWIYEMVKDPVGVYFISRPRRFGKSLLVSTLSELFAGNRELFEGLWIDQSDYQWETHPIIRINFSQEKVKNASELQVVLSDYLNDIASDYGLTLPQSRLQRQFVVLIRQLAATGQVVILIDEYDKPIIDNMTNVEEAKRIRDVLKGFYTVIKAMDEYVRFVLLTGVSKFSKAGVFSELNNLEDITMTPDFSAALGITEEEIHKNFSEYLANFAAQERVSPEELLLKIRDWYDGFCFSTRCQKVYNPFSLLLCFKQRRFANFWFETGTPTFLINLIKEKQYEIGKLESLEVGELAFSSYEIGNLGIVSLLFQTGYLTIKGYHQKEGFGLYTLYYPNREVKMAFLEYLLGSFGHMDNGASEAYLWELAQALRSQDFKRFFEIMGVFFANIPYDIQIKREKYYQTIFYLILKLIRLKVEAEVRTNIGRIDTVVELSESIFIFEFKLAGSAQEAIKQIKEKEYYQKYKLSGKELYLVGVNFEMEKRALKEWKVEKYEPESTL